MALKDPAFKTPKDATIQVSAELNLRARAFMDLVLNKIRNYTVDNLSGKVLKVRTGRLRGSIFTKTATSTNNRIHGSIGTNVFYGKIWELTGHKGFTVVPRTKQALTIPVGAQKSATSKSSVILRTRATIKAQKPRPFIAPAIEKADAFIKALHAKRFSDVMSKVKVEAEVNG